MIRFSDGKPRENTSGFETMTLLTLSFAKNSTGTDAKKLLARSFFNGFRTSSILKYLSVNTVIEMVTDCLKSKDDLTACLKSVFKAGVTYSKPLDEIVSNLNLYSQPLETLNDQRKVIVSICLIESVQPLLTSTSGAKQCEDGRKQKCETIFKSLSRAMLKGLKGQSVDIEVSLIVSGLTSVIDIHCQKQLITCLLL